MADSNFLGARRAITWVARLISYLVYAYVVVVEVILGIGFFLLLFGANPTNDFVEWIYRSLNRAMEPFRGIFPQETVGESGSIINFAMAFAIIMYGIFALLVHALVDWLDRQIRKRRQALEQEQAEERARQQYQASLAQQGQLAGQDPSQPGQPPGGAPVTAQVQGGVQQPGTAADTAPQATPQGDAGGVAQDPPSGTDTP